MQQMECAKRRIITSEMKHVSKTESVDVQWLCDRVAHGEIVILKNKVHHGIEPIGIGKDLRTKVNANIGTSPENMNITEEIEKAKVAIRYGADTLMDLSIGGDLVEVRRRIMAEVPAIIGTVPVYEAVIRAIREKGSLTRMTVEDIFQVLEEQAKEGVDFFTIHCGVTRKSLEVLQRQGRLIPMVSRGGTFLAAWMLATGKENPFFEFFEDVLQIAQTYDITLSLGDGMRPGAIADATDGVQIEELIQLGELTKRAWEKNVQVMIEGPGHIPLHEVDANVRLAKRLCHNAPFYVLGPLVTDIAPGYDHITSAIGGAVASAAGADFLCYVTPGEHLKLPDLEEVRQGVIASRIAAHAGDIAKGVAHAEIQDLLLSTARRNLDWKTQFRYAIDPQHAKALRDKADLKEEKVCTMCGEFCAIRWIQNLFQEKSTDQQKKAKKRTSRSCLA